MFKVSRNDGQATDFTEILGSEYEVWNISDEKAVYAEGAISFKASAAFIAVATPTNDDCSEAELDMLNRTLLNKASRIPSNLVVVYSIDEYWKKFGLARNMSSSDMPCMVAQSASISFPKGCNRI